jgi:hypothetical protein
MIKTKNIKKNEDLIFSIPDGVVVGGWVVGGSIIFCSPYISRQTDMRDVSGRKPIDE